MEILSNPILWAVAGGIVFLAGRYALTFWLSEKHWINETLEGPDLKGDDQDGGSGSGGGGGGFWDCGGGDGGGGGGE